MVSQVHRVGGVAHLVVDHRDLAVGLAQIDHGLDEVFAVVAVQPGSAHDKVAAAEALHILFAQQLGLAVSRNRRGQAAFVQRRVPVGTVGGAGEHIIGGNMDQPGIDLVTGQGQVAGAQGVDLESRIPVGFAAVDVGESRTVDDGVRLMAADISHGGFPVGDVQFVNIHGNHSSLAQPVGQRPQDAPFLPKLPLQLGPKLPAAAGDQNFHSLQSPSLLNT